MNDIAKRQENEIVEQRIFRNIPEITVLHQELEVLQADEMASENTFVEIVVHKCDISAGHYRIVEDYEIQDYRQQHEKQDSVLDQFPDYIPTRMHKSGQ
ncbi:hypothetical protein D3C75_949700 [compost metagenome]